MKNFNNLDGEVDGIEYYDAVVSDNNIGARVEDLSASNGETYSGIIPLVAGVLSQTPKGQQVVKGTFLDKDVRAENRANRQERRAQRFQTRMDAKTARNQAKLTTAEALKQSATDDVTAQALAQTPASSTGTAGGSNTMKYALIGVGVLVVGFIVYKVATKKSGK